MASILDARLARQFMNSDAFFAFSAIGVQFRQVAVNGLWLNARDARQIMKRLLHCERSPMRCSGAPAQARSAVLVPLV
jgi:hypothetical protein